MKKLISVLVLISSSSVWNMFKGLSFALCLLLIVVVSCSPHYGYGGYGGGYGGYGGGYGGNRYNGYYGRGYGKNNLFY